MNTTSKIVIAIIAGSIIIGGFAYVAVKSAPETVKNNDVPAKIESATTLSKVQLSQCEASEHTVVTKVIDGDTVVVQGGHHVRLLGIDADEKNYPCYEPAKSRLEELVLNKQVVLEKDISDVDQYKRCLRTLFLGSWNIGVQLVKEGLAVDRFYEPDIKYKREIQAAEQEAVASKTGCKWQK